MKKGSIFIFMTLLLFNGLIQAAPTNSQNTTFEMYKDVPQTHWAYDAIFELSQKGVMIGYFDKNDKSFKGEKNLTRYEFALALAKAMIRIEENIKAERKGDMDIESFLKSKNVPPKDIELMTLLMQEFKSELSELNMRITKMEEYHKRSPHSNLALYFSIGSLLASFAALTIAIQK